MNVTRVFLFLFVCFTFLSCVHTARYAVGEEVPVWVDRVGPFQNPQEFYMYHSLPFCRPENNKGRLEGLGESIAGYELRQSDISLSFAVPTRSGVVCEKELSFEEASIFTFAINNQYWYQMFIDDLPVWGLVGEVIESDNKRTVYLYTHLHFDISKNEERVISVNLTSEGAVLVQEGAEVSFTYSVSWSNTKETHGNRFKSYLDTSFFEHQIHWFSLFNSSMLFVFLVGLVGMIAMRTMRKDFVLGEDDPDEITDEAGWKLLHRDVFRPPNQLTLFSAVIGLGYQLIIASLLVLTLGYFGAKYYQSRGAIISAFIAWYIICSFFGGMGSGSIFAKNKGSKWIKTAFVTSLLYPLPLFFTAGVTFFAAKSYGALSYTPFAASTILGIMWTIFCVPLVIIGTLFGRHFARNFGRTELNSGVNQVPRLIPIKPWYLRTSGVLLWSGLLPFSTIFVELYFVYTSIFHYKFYYVYGFAEIIFVLLILVTMLVNILVTYILLNSEDHKWHWTSVKTGFSVSFYVFVYALYYYFYRTNMTGTLQFVHFISINFCIAMTVGFICSAASYFAASFFVVRIYRGLKVD